MLWIKTMAATLTWPTSCLRKSDIRSVCKEQQFGTRIGTWRRHRLRYHFEVAFPVLREPWNLLNPCGQTVAAALFSTRWCSSLEPAKWRSGNSEFYEHGMYNMQTVMHALCRHVPKSDLQGGGGRVSNEKSLCWTQTCPSPCWSKSNSS